MNNVHSLSGKKTPAEVLREVDADHPDAKAVIVLALKPDNSVYVAASLINDSQVVWMNHILTSLVITNTGRKLTL